MAQVQTMTHATRGDSLADILERVLNTGVVIAGDVKIKIADVELLSIQIRLVVCSVNKAKELGIQWWWQQPEPSMPDTSEPNHVRHFEHEGVAPPCPALEEFRSFSQEQCTAEKATAALQRKLNEQAERAL